MIKFGRDAHDCEFDDRLRKAAHEFHRSIDYTLLRRCSFNFVGQWPISVSSLQPPDPALSGDQHTLFLDSFSV
jgi:hypothetical protein